MRKVSADAIVTGDGDVLVDHVIIVEGDEIMDLLPKVSFEPSDIEQYEGLLVPGFVNAHCHLELSHMKGIIPSGTGLISFIKAVISQRDFNQEVILDAINLADLQMRAEGIVAVGDISNTAHTLFTKCSSPIAYYNFIECFDLLLESQAETHFENYLKIYRQFINVGLKSTSLVPHAPYSVSKKMFSLLKETYGEESHTISIHNQETPGENQLFIDKTGDLIDFYDFVGIDLADFVPNGLPSIQYALPLMDASQKSLLVHNTECTSEDIAFAEKWSSQVYFCTCPNANLYIENRLPNYDLFINANAKICIGSDSLASNWRLSILDEMMTISKYNSSIPIQDIIQWATKNGAEALGMSDRLGSIAKGKTPGINLIQADLEKNTFKASSPVQKIV